MFSGSIVALITPMSADGSVDYVALKRLVEFHIENETDAIVATGTTGECATLDFEEHRQVIRKIVEYVDGRLPVIAGTGGNSTLEAVKLTHWAREDGAQACLLVVPYYNRPTQEGLYQHFKLISESVDIPQILYNVPSRCACDLLPETVERLAQLPNIVGIKEASSLERIKDLIVRVGSKIAILSGDDPIAVDTVLAGGKGVISVTANVAPKKMHDMLAAALAGDEATARAIDETLKPLHRHLFIESSPMPVKWAVSQLKLCDNALRLPLVPLSAHNYPIVQEAMQAAGII